MSRQASCDWTTFRKWAERRTGWHIPPTSTRTRPAHGIIPTILDGLIESPGSGAFIDYTAQVRRRFLALVHWRRHALEDIRDNAPNLPPARLFATVDEHDDGWYVRGHDREGWVASEAEAEWFIREMLKRPAAFAVIPIPTEAEVELT